MLWGLKFCIFNFEILHDHIESRNTAKNNYDDLFVTIIGDDVNKVNTRCGGSVVGSVS